MIKNRWNSTIVRKIKGTTPRRGRKKGNCQEKENPTPKKPTKSRGKSNALKEKNFQRSPSPQLTDMSSPLSSPIIDEKEVNISVNSIGMFFFFS